MTYTHKFCCICMETVDEDHMHIKEGDQILDLTEYLAALATCTPGRNPITVTVTQYVPEIRGHHHDHVFIDDARELHTVHPGDFDLDPIPAPDWPVRREVEVDVQRD